VIIRRYDICSAGRGKLLPQPLAHLVSHTSQDVSAILSEFSTSTKFGLMLLDRRIDDYIELLCGRCGHVATLEFTLPEYVKIYGCDACEESMRHILREVVQTRKL